MKNETPASDTWKKSPAKKDTRAWCKGKVAREHEPVIIVTKWPYQGTQCGMTWDLYPRMQEAYGRRKSRYTENKWRCFHIEACTVCGKYLKDPLPSELCPLNHN